MLMLMGALCGCTTTYELAMYPAKPVVVDESAVPAAIARYKRIMVVPPVSRGRSDIEAELATIERELMRNGVVLISAHSAPDDPPRVPGDIDRVMRAAQSANADAILEISHFGTVKAVERSLGARFFVPEGAGVIHDLGDDMQRLVLLKSGNKLIVETDEATYGKIDDDMRKLSRIFEDDVVEFTGRLVEVQSREVVASLHYYAPGVRCGRPYYEIMNNRGKTTGVAYDWATEDARRMRRVLARKAIITAVAERLSGGGAL